MFASFNLSNLPMLPFSPLAHRPFRFCVLNPFAMPGQAGIVSLTAPESDGSPCMSGL